MLTVEKLQTKADTRNQSRRDSHPSTIFRSYGVNKDTKAHKGFFRKETGTCLFLCFFACPACPVKSFVFFI